MASQKMRLNIMNKSLLQPSVKFVRPLLRNVTILLGLLLLWSGAAPAPAASATVTNSFVWNKDKEQMSADVRDWELLGLLETIAAETGWHVYVEPDDNFRASVKFKDLPTGQALRRLLGDMNFAMLPQTNGPQRLYVFRTAMGNATKQVRHGNVRSAPKPKKVPNELIIRVKPGTDIEALAKTLGAKIVGKIPELNAYRLQFESEAAAEAARKKLLANPEVTSVENNYYLESPLNPQSLGGRAATPTKLTLSPVKRDSGKVVVGLVDTALQKQTPELEQLIKERVSLAGDSPASSTQPTHADAMLNALAQAMQQALGDNATGVQIIHVDVFGQSAGANTFTAALGMYEAYKRGATIINDSFGSYGESEIMSEVVKFLAGENVPVFAAVGNDGSATPFSPASIPEVIAVTATERGQIAPYANVGTTPDAAAPGMVMFYFNGLVYGSRGTSVSSAAATGFTAGMADLTGAPFSRVLPVVQKSLAVPTGN
jgi:thermitase